MRSIFASFIVAVILTSGAVAEPLDDARRAFESGDYATAIGILRRLAEQGNHEAQHTLAYRYVNGEGVLQDYAEAAKWFRQAAEEGYVPAQVSLGYAYVIGQGVQQDFSEAEKWYRLAAEHGDAAAQDGLGLMYLGGTGVAQDDAEAAKWFRRAAEQGYPAAQCNLGTSYATGRGVPQDYAEAMKWYRLAAEQGFPQGQYDLGIMYAEGEGVPQDYVRAHMWFNLAATNGFKEAAQDRETVAARMTPAQIAEAQKLAREWKPKPVVDEEPSAGVRVESPYMEEPTPPVQPVPGSQRLDSPPPATINESFGETRWKSYTLPAELSIDVPEGWRVLDPNEEALNDAFGKQMLGEQPPRINVLPTEHKFALHALDAKGVLMGSLYVGEIPSDDPKFQRMRNQGMMSAVVRDPAFARKIVKDHDKIVHEKTERFFSQLGFPLTWLGSEITKVGELWAFVSEYEWTLLMKGNPYGSEEVFRVREIKIWNEGHTCTLQVNHSKEFPDTAVQINTMLNTLRSTGAAPPSGDP